MYSKIVDTYATKDQIITYKNILVSLNFSIHYIIICFFITTRLHLDKNAN